MYWILSRGNKRCKDNFFRLREPQTGLLEFSLSPSVLKEKLDLVPEVLTLKLTLVNPRAKSEVLLRSIVSCLKDSSGALI